MVEAGVAASTKRSEGTERAEPRAGRAGRWRADLPRLARPDRAGDAEQLARPLPRLLAGDRWAAGHRRRGTGRVSACHRRLSAQLRALLYADLRHDGRFVRAARAWP